MISKENKPESNLKYLDGIRAIAALYVTLHHASLQFDPNQVSSIGKIVIKLLRYGGLSVSLFIVLSGFCLMLSITKANYQIKGGAALFFKKRIIRILPPYYLAMALSMILIETVVGAKTGTHWDISLGYGYKDIISHILLVHDFWESSLATINHVFWSIAVEFRIYLFFPFLVYFWRKTGALPTLGISVLLAFIMYTILVAVKTRVNDISLHEGVTPFIILFVLGMIAADYSFSNRIKEKWETKIPWGFLAVLSFLGYFVILNLTYQQNVVDIGFGNKLKTSLFGIPCMCALIAASRFSNTKTNWFQKFLALKPLVFLGTFSYSLYLIHAPLIQLMTQLAGNIGLSTVTTLWFLLLLCITLIPAIAYIFFLICERPFMSFGHKLRVIQADKELKTEVANK